MSLVADDTVNFNNSNDFSEVQEHLQNDFDLICQWCYINKMYIHPQNSYGKVLWIKKKVGEQSCIN